MNDLKNLFGEDKQAEDSAETESTAAGKNDDFPEPASFEDAMSELEALVRELESGRLPLQDSIDVYKKARSLAAWCYKSLTEFQGELKKLGLDEDGNFRLDDLPPVE